MTAALGVNDDEIGVVVKRALDTPYVGGVTIQPVFGSGRHGGIDPLDRLTHTGVLARLEAADRRHRHLARPDRAAVLAPALLLGGLPAARRHRQLAVADVADRPRQASRRGSTWSRRRWRTGSPTTRSRRGCGPWSRTRCSTCSASSRRCRTRRSASVWKDICENCDLGIGTLTTLATASLPGQHKRLRQLLGERVVRITVKPFMDMSTMIEERLLQCCVHVGTVGAGRRPPVRAVLRRAGVGPAGRAQARHRHRPCRTCWRCCHDVRLPRAARDRRRDAVRPAAAVRLRDDRAAGLAARPAGAARLRGAGTGRLHRGPTAPG